MRLWDATGYLASGLVVVAFCLKDIIPLRVVALISNVAFLIYGIGLGLVPVCLLHAILLPVNSWRLWDAIACRCKGRPQIRHQ
jgi:CRP/FNR family cyclic AMP-dependent transcriptional regulator